MTRSETVIDVRALDPAAVGAEVEAWVLDHVRTLLFALGAMDTAIQPAVADCRLAARELTAYAQGHPDACADCGHEPAEYIQSVVEALYTAAHPSVYRSVDGDWSSRDDPEHAIDAVLRVAMARDRLSSVVQTAVPLAWLAPWTGTTVKRLRNLAAAGEITVVDGDVEPDEAIRWLSGRGITITRRVLR